MIGGPLCLVSSMIGGPLCVGRYVIVLVAKEWRSFEIVRIEYSIFPGRTGSVGGRYR